MRKLYNYSFPTPSYLSMGACAIDVSDQSIKYGEIIATSSGPKLSKFGKVDISRGVVIAGKIEREEEMARLLKTIKEKEKINFVRVSLPEEQTYLFTLTLPKVSDQNIREMILFQMEEHIPLKAPDSVFDYNIISEDNRSIIVEVVATSQIIISKYLSVCDKAGLIPVSFEIEAQAIARAVVPSGDISPVVIVDFGDSTTGISISKDGRVFMTTTISIGGKDLTNMIAKSFSISFEEAEKMKHKYGLNQGSEAQNIFPDILNGISVLRDEISKQCTFWNNRNGDDTKEKISRIILCGGNANLAGLADYLELSLKTKVENANVWVNILNTEESVPEMPFEESLGYATVIGLSLGEYLYKSQPVINVLPDSEKKKLRSEYWMRFLSVFSNLVAIAGITATFLLFPSYFFSQSRESLAENRLQEFNKENPDLSNNNINNITNDINSKLALLNQAEVPYNVSDKIFNNILSNRTEGIQYSQIVFNNKYSDTGAKINEVDIYGIAKDRYSLRNFKTFLDQNPNFEKVDLPISDFLEKSNLSFTITIIMK